MVKYDYSAIPYFDNHTHELDYDRTGYTPEELSISFLHGFRDMPAAAGNGEDWISAGQAQDLRNLGVVKTMVCMMAKRFGCAPNLDAVTEYRNSLTLSGQEEYAKVLYREAGIIGCMIDSGFPMGDLRTRFPCRTFRLFRMDPVLTELKRQCQSYAELKKTFLDRVCEAVGEGYAGIKCHIGEIHTLQVRYVTEYEAEKAYASAILGDPKASELVYFAIFCEMMKLCGEKDIPIHIHTGCTGGSGNGRIGELNPLLMAEFLNDREFQKTKIVFLHGSYPDIRNAALMTHMFPNIWMDLSWVSPWTSMDYENILQAVLGVAVHSRVLLGTGQHGIPEMSWMAAHLARRSLEHIMEGLSAQGIISEEQAYDTAEQLLVSNARRLYHFPEEGER